MSLSADALLDRLQLKRQAQKWRVIAIVIAVASALLFISAQSNRSPIGGNYIARLTIEGFVGDNVERDALIEELKTDSSVKAVIVRLDTPGGSAVAGEEVYRQLRSLAKEKPVVAVMRTMSTSAGYMIALGADRIYARDGTLTGSIGVLLQSAEFTDLAKKLGVTPITIKSSPLKGSPTPLEKVTPAVEQSLQAIIDDFYLSFVAMVEERRGFSHEQALKLSDGRVFTGKQAFERKLIDQLGGEEEALAWLEKEKNLSKSLKIKDVEPKKKDGNLFERMADTVSRKLFPEAAMPLDGLVSIWHPGLQIQ